MTLDDAHRSGTPRVFGEMNMTDINLTEGDYVLVDGAAWIAVKNLSIRIRSDNEQAIVEIYALGKEMDEPLTVTRAFFEDANPTEELA